MLNKCWLLLKNYVMKKFEQRLKAGNCVIYDWCLERARWCGKVKRLVEEEEKMTEIEGGCSKQK